MDPPTAMDRLLGIFERLNSQLWPAHIVAIGLALAALALVVVRDGRARLAVPANP